MIFLLILFFYLPVKFVLFHNLRVLNHLNRLNFLSGLFSFLNSESIPYAVVAEISSLHQLVLQRDVDILLPYNQLCKLLPHAILEAQKHTYSLSKLIPRREGFGLYLTDQSGDLLIIDLMSDLLRRGHSILDPVRVLNSTVCFHDLYFMSYSNLMLYHQRRSSFNSNFLRSFCPDSVLDTLYFYLFDFYSTKLPFHSSFLIALGVDGAGKSTLINILSQSLAVIQAIRYLIFSRVFYLATDQFPLKYPINLIALPSDLYLFSYLKYFICHRRLPFTESLLCLKSFL